MEDPIKHRQRSLRWRDRHPEYVRASAKRWRERNKDYASDYAKRWRAIPENREKMMEKSRRYREVNREAIKVARAMGISVNAARDLLQAIDNAEKRDDGMISISVDTAEQMAAAYEAAINEREP